MKKLWQIVCLLYAACLASEWGSYVTSIHIRLFIPCEVWGNRSVDFCMIWSKRILDTPKPQKGKLTLQACHFLLLIIHSGWPGLSMNQDSIYLKKKFLFSFYLSFCEKISFLTKLTGRHFAFSKVGTVSHKETFTSNNQQWTPFQKKFPTEWDLFWVAI